MYLFVTLFHSAFQNDQATLGLAGKDYFLKNDSQIVQDEYYKLMVKTAALLGAEREYAQTEMQKVLKF